MDKSEFLGKVQYLKYIITPEGVKLYKELKAFILPTN